MEKHYTKDEVMKWAIEHDLYANVIKAIKYYGLEGTEDAIHRVYNKMPKLKEEMLRVFWNILNGQKPPQYPGEENGR